MNASYIFNSLKQNVVVNLPFTFSCTIAIINNIHMHINTLNAHNDSHALVLWYENMFLFRTLSFPNLACKSGLPLLLLPPIAIYILIKIHKFNLF